MARGTTGPRRARCGRRLLWLTTLCCSSAAPAAAAGGGPLVVPLVPHHVQRARRRLQGAAAAERPVPWHARRRLDDAEQDSQHLLQVAALYQGYGTHYADLWCGTPPQRQTVIVDTGSGVTAFPCAGCSGGCGVPEYHLDALFAPDESASFHALACDECLRGSCSRQQCQMGMSYQEGSSWSAYEVQDQCYVGGLHQRPLDGDSNRDDDKARDDLNPFHAPAFAFPLSFGCQTKITGLFVTQLADGIMGMDNAPSAFWAQMSNRIPASIDRSFALCFSRAPTADRAGTGAGAMTMGGVDARLHGSDMVYAAVLPGQGFYSVHVRKMYLRAGGESALAADAGAQVVPLDLSESELNRGSVIVDSGTTDTYYNNAIASAFKSAWSQLAGDLGYSHSAVELTEEQLLALPTVLVQLQGDEARNRAVADAAGGRPVVGLAGDLDADYPYDVVLAIPASHYFEYDDSTGKYTNRFYVDEGGGSVLGANAMMGHDVFFDIDGSVIGLAESSCDYQALVQPFLDSGDLVPIDPDGGDSSRQSGQDNPEDDDDDGEGSEQVEVVGDDDDVADSQIDPYTSGPAEADSFCDQYPCPTIGMIVGVLAVSLLVVPMVLRRRRGPRYSEATMSELELRVTASLESDDGDNYRDSYRDLHAREIT